MRIRTLLFFIAFSFSLLGLRAQPKTDAFFQDLLSKSDHELLKNVLLHRDSFRLQVIYTQIDRDKSNTPAFKNYYLNVDPALYFNPASTVKLPLAILALEKLRSLGKADVTRYTPIQFDSSFRGQVKAWEDNTSENGLPSIAHYIKKAFLVSDNDAYNRLYQFIGQGPINRSLQEKGFKNTRINRQFMGFSEEQNRHTNAVRFISEKGDLIYQLPAAYNADPIEYKEVIKIGQAHLNGQDSLIHEPIDFSRANKVSLEDLQQILQTTMFPESVSSHQRFKLTESDYSFLYQYLSQYPSETNFPKYDTAEYYDSYVKFYFRGNKKMPDQVRVFNKVGWAYGFLIDVSYVVDFKNKVEFMLTSTLYTNSDGVLNDNKYEYKTVGWPFLHQLGQTVYQYELERPRNVKPDLSKFKVRYDQRDINDQRATIKEVDN